VQHELWLPLQLCSWNSVLSTLHLMVCAAWTVRGNTNRPTLFQLQSWRGSHNSCCTYHQVQSWQHTVPTTKLKGKP
jgi:hypothetical protein